MLQDAARFVESLREREEQLVAKEAIHAQKLRIANIASQRLHIYTTNQMIEFCKKYWESFSVLAEVADLTDVQHEAGRKPRQGPVARVVAAHESRK